MKIERASIVTTQSAHSLNVHSALLLILQPQNGGVVMVVFYNDYVTCSKNATLSDVAGDRNISPVHVLMFQQYLVKEGGGGLMFY